MNEFPTTTPDPAPVASSGESANRRPIRARELSIFKSMSAALARWGATPNGISVAGMLTGLVGGAALAATRFEGWATIGFLVAPVCIALRLLCNMLDGMVAIDGGRTSKLGEVFNELPDRISDAATLTGVGYALGGHPVLGLVAAMIAVLVAYVRSVGVNAGASQQFQGPMAKQQRMTLIAGTSLLVAIVPSLRVIASWPDATGAMTVALALVVAGSLVTIVRRLWGIADELNAADRSAP